MVYLFFRGMMKEEKELLFLVQEDTLAHQVLRDLQDQRVIQEERVSLDLMVSLDHQAMSSSFQ